MKIQSVEVLGIPVTLLQSYDHAVDYIMSRIKAGKKTFCIAINPEKIYKAQSNAELNVLINSADLHICDGVGAAIGAKILTGRAVTRITGVQLFLDLIARAEVEELNIFLLGAKPESSQGAYAKLMQMHPNLRIVGRRDGYFTDDIEVVNQINDSKTEMLFVAIGSPKQERWISKYRNKILAPYCMGVGGTFDVISGEAKYAPMIFRKTGTEFLFRLISEPRRWRRQICYPVFMMKIIKSKLLGKS